MGKRRPGTLGDSHRQPARPTAKDHAFIDTNADSEFPTWLIRHGLAIPTGRTMQSGFCTYPEYRFRANRLQELDLEGYAGYLNNFERRYSA